MYVATLTFVSYTVDNKTFKEEKFRDLLGSLIMLGVLLNRNSFYILNLVIENFCGLLKIYGTFLPRNFHLLWYK